MAELTNPLEIAREALRRLAAERIPPTPENYRAHYLRIAETTLDEAPLPEERLARDLVAALPRASDEAAQFATQCEQALASRDWASLGKLLAKQLTSRQEVSDWNELLRTLVQLWDSSQGGLTQARKRESLDHLLQSTRAPDLLGQRLRNLLTQWARMSKAEPPPSGAEAAPPPVPAPEQRPEESGPDDSTLSPLVELCAFLLDTPLAANLASNPALADEARGLGLKARSATSREGIKALLPQVRRLAMRIELAAEDQQELTAGVIHLLQLVVDNISELVIDDRWLGGQINVLQDILAKPLDLRAINNAERRLRDVIVRQSTMKASLADAQRSLKHLLSEFVSHLANFARDTGAYHDRMDSYSTRISRAEHVIELQDVVQELLRETKGIQLTAQNTHTELQAARASVEAAEHRVAALEAQLAQTSQLVRHDQLTGTLNRRGLEEVLEREIARAERRQSSLCLAVLDVDNFKQLNDALGHQAGDAALVHLTSVIRSTLRPEDTLARYGGEEFIVLLPETGIEDAQSSLIRMQRELTRRFFLHNNQRVLVTFSAGVTPIPAGETKDTAIARADQLMYQAKRSGKNQVVIG